MINKTPPLKKQNWEMESERILKTFVLRKQRENAMKTIEFFVLNEKSVWVRWVYGAERVFWDFLSKLGPNAALYWVWVCWETASERERGVFVFDSAFSTNDALQCHFKRVLFVEEVGSEIK